jgi:NADH-quinone oxidoreductase subunit K
MSVGLNAILVASAALFAVGAFALIARRSALTALLGTQFMFAAGAIAFVAFGRFSVLAQTPAAAHQNLAGAMALFVGATAVAELAVGLAMAALIYRESRSFSVDADGG